LSKTTGFLVKKKFDGISGLSKKNISNGDRKSLRKAGEQDDSILLNKIPRWIKDTKSPAGMFFSDKNLKFKLLSLLKVNAECKYPLSCK
jgi:hypothetical protein